MEFGEIDKKLECYQKRKEYSEIFPLQHMEEYFTVTYTHESTAIEGNTLSLAETKALLIDKVSVGDKRLNEVLEIINHSDAFAYIKHCVWNQSGLTKDIILEAHKILMNRIMNGGIYRSQEVYITGSEYEPPKHMDVPVLMEKFYQETAFKSAVCGMQEALHPIQLAAWTHAEFVHIHPFIDGNGRTARLLLNYQLLKHNFLPVSIPKVKAVEYYNALDEYHFSGSTDRFVKLICELEEEQLDKMIHTL